MKPLTIIAAAAALIAGAALVATKQGVAAETTIAGHDIDLGKALKAIDAAVEKATALDTKMNIAVVDAGGNLKAFVRMDGAFLGSADIAMRKARTARLFDAPSGALGTLSQPGGPLFGIEESNGGLITFPGGLPIMNKNGVVIGAIGVSGSSVENDLAVAEAGVAAL